MKQENKPWDTNLDLYYLKEDLKIRYKRSFTNNPNSKSINKYKYIALLFVKFGGQNARAKKY